MDALLILFALLWFSRVWVIPKTVLSKVLLYVGENKNSNGKISLD